MWPKKASTIIIKVFLSSYSPLFFSPKSIRVKLGVSFIFSTIYIFYIYFHVFTHLKAQNIKFSSRVFKAVLQSLLFLYSFANTN